MNAGDILKYGHLTVLRSIDGLPDSAWDVDGVCGVWSVKDIIGHLAAFEHVLVDVLNSFLGGPNTGYLGKFENQEFNDTQAALRHDRPFKDVLAEYNEMHEQVRALVPRIGTEKWREVGTLPWYGKEYALDDYVVYAFYGHKREHTAQIDKFRDTLKKK